MAWIALMGAAPSAADPPVESPDATTVLILPLEAKDGVTKDLADQVTGVLALQADSIPGFRVTSFREVERTLSQEQVRQLTGCSLVSCAVEIAGALNVDQIVMGSVGRVGQSFLLVLARVEARTASVVKRALTQVPGNEAHAILVRLPPVVASLFQVDESAITAARVVPSSSEKARSDSPAPPATGRAPLTALRWGLRAGSGGGAVFALLTTLVAAASAGVVGVAAAVDFLAPKKGDQQHALTANQALGADLSLVLGVVAAAGTLVLLGVSAGMLATSFVVPS